MRWGGDLDGRTRLLVEVVDAVRAVWPDDKAVAGPDQCRPTGWTAGSTSTRRRRSPRVLADRGVDLVDVSSGGNSPDQKIAPAPGYQVPLATRIKQESGLPVAAVGLITEPQQAEQIVAAGRADAVFLGRELLRDPSFAQRAAAELGADVYWPGAVPARPPVAAGRRAPGPRRGEGLACTTWRG